LIVVLLGRCLCFLLLVLVLRCALSLAENIAHLNFLTLVD
jgi:hypothetical protein